MSAVNQSAGPRRTERIISKKLNRSRRLVLLQLFKVDVNKNLKEEFLLKAQENNKNCLLFGRLRVEQEI